MYSSIESRSLSASRAQFSRTLTLQPLHHLAVLQNLARFDLLERMPDFPDEPLFVVEVSFNGLIYDPCP
jgi:hypothetical protein